VDPNVPGGTFRTSVIGHIGSLWLEANTSSPPRKSTAHIRSPDRRWAARRRLRVDEERREGGSVLTKIRQQLGPCVGGATAALRHALHASPVPAPCVNSTSLATWNLEDEVPERTIGPVRIRRMLVVVVEPVDAGIPRTPARARRVVRGGIGPQDP